MTEDVRTEHGDAENLERPSDFPATDPETNGVQPPLVSSSAAAETPAAASGTPLEAPISNLTSADVPSTDARTTDRPESPESQPSGTAPDDSSQAAPDTTSGAVAEDTSGAAPHDTAGEPPAVGAPTEAGPDVQVPAVEAHTEPTPVQAPAAGTPAPEPPSAETPTETPAGTPSEAVTAQTPAVETPADAPVAATTPSAPDVGGPSAQAPRPNPGRNAGGRPGRPSGGRPPGTPGGRGGSRSNTGQSKAITIEPTVEPTDPHKWGRIDESGVAYVYGPLGERPVGSWQAGDVEAGLAHFARRFDDFATEIALLETRLATGSGDPKATRTHAIELRESVDTLSGIGDLDSAAARLEIVIGAADAAIAGASTARAAARAAAVAAKEALCVEAETLAESEQWKATGDRLKEIVDEWRTIKGIDRKTDDALWKRFAKARDTFTRHRGTHFADLDKQRGAAKEAKEVLIARAEALSESTEWGKTAGDYRTLMEEWKASGRAPRDVEDALWDRFRAAQEKFFSHRNQTFSERDQEFESNAAVKEKLLAEAEKISTATGLDGAKAALRSIQERWEAAGKVPRERIKEFDSRLRAVEDKIRSAEDSHWRRTDPETSARIEQFRSRADSYRAQAVKARAAGNERKAKEAEAQAAQWEEWLAAAENVVER